MVSNFLHSDRKKASFVHRPQLTPVERQPKQGSSINCQNPHYKNRSLLKAEIRSKLSNNFLVSPNKANSQSTLKGRDKTKGKTTIKQNFTVKRYLDLLPQQKIRDLLRITQVADMMKSEKVLQLKSKQAEKFYTEKLVHIAQKTPKTE